jgi:hypothetical protein
MKFLRLIDQGKTKLAGKSQATTLTTNVFGSGAEWMFVQLNENKDASFNKSIQYSAYGFLKYSISLLAFFVSAFLFFRINVWLVPISIIVFYLVEIHFLFLFPLLIDNVKRPLLTSIRETYRTGIFTALFNVIPIGVYMIMGLFRLKDPFRNWYIGCLAIVVWYNEEVRNRV